MTDNKNYGKSPYRTGNSARRGKGRYLLVTVIILLIAAGAWISSYTRAVATSPVQALSPVDPAAHGPPVTK